MRTRASPGWGSAMLVVCQDRELGFSVSVWMIAFVVMLMVSTLMNHCAAGNGMRGGGVRFRWVGERRSGSWRISGGV